MDGNLLLCSCTCMSSLLTVADDLSFKQTCLSSLPLLFERANEFMMFQNSVYSSILDCIQSLSKSIIQWNKKSSQTAVISQVVPLFIEKQQSSDDRMISICRTAILGCLQNCNQLPSSIVKTVAEYLFSEVNAVANGSKTNYISVFFELS